MINHEDGLRRQIVVATPKTSDQAGYAEAARKAIAANVQLPAGVYLRYGGEAAGADRSRARAAAAFGRRVRADRAAARRSRSVTARHVLLVLLALPSTLIGGVVAVALTGGTLTLGAMVGFVALFGMAARNTILLVSHYDHLVREEGADVESRDRAARRRGTPDAGAADGVADRARAAAGRAAAEAAGPRDRRADGGRDPRRARFVDAGQPAADSAAGGALAAARLIRASRVRRWKAARSVRVFEQLAAPFARMHVRDRLRKRPDVAAGILRRVLPLAVRIVGRHAEDLRAGLARPFEMTVDIVDVHHHRMRRSRARASGSFGPSMTTTEPPPNVNWMR